MIELDELPAAAALARIEVEHDRITTPVVRERDAERTPPDRLDRPINSIRRPIVAEPVAVFLLPLAVPPPHRLYSGQSHDLTVVEEPRPSRPVRKDSRTSSGRKSPSAFSKASSRRRDAPFVNRNL